MSVIMIDGPEKAGKTTLANLLTAVGAAGVRHWTWRNTYRDYLAPLLQDSRSPEIWVWDRAWACEHVYDWMLGRKGLLGSDPWYGEWVFSRVTRVSGVLVMMLGPSAEALAIRRTPDDHPVDPRAERAAFEAYGRQFGWTMQTTDPDPGLAQRLMTTVKANQYPGMPVPPLWVGPADAPIIFVGDTKNGRNEWGGQVPFSTRLTQGYGRALGPTAMHCAWTTTEADPDWFTRARAVIACGQVAANWCRQTRVGHTAVIPHPAWLYRYSDAAEQIGSIESELRALVNKTLEATNNVQAD